MDIQNTYFGIIGLARSGIAAAYKIKALGGKAFLSDNKTEKEIPEAEELKRQFDCEFGGNSDQLLECDCIIVSPGVPVTVPILQKAVAKGVELISEIEFGFRIKHPSSRIIAVTGSNGKSTTVSLINHILVQAGYQSTLAGNIGDAFTGFPIEKEGTDCYVLEISSFQLDLIRDFCPDVAVLLNITPDHLNRYNSFEDYALAKFNLFRNTKNNQQAIINLDDPVIEEHLSLIKGAITHFSLQQNCNCYFDSCTNCIYYPQKRPSNPYR